jgi:hypothetical protein
MHAEALTIELSRHTIKQEFILQVCIIMLTQHQTLAFTVLYNILAWIGTIVNISNTVHVLRHKWSYLMQPVLDLNIQ